MMIIITFDFRAFRGRMRVLYLRFIEEAILLLFLSPVYWARAGDALDTVVQALV